MRDHSILNVIAMVREKSFLIGVEKMSACNHATFSQAIIKCVTEVGIKYKQVIAIVSDSAAYCKKAFRDVLSAVFPNSIHVRCLAHIVNLASELFRSIPISSTLQSLFHGLSHPYSRNLGKKHAFSSSSLTISHQVKLNFHQNLWPLDGIPGLRQLSTIPPEFTCMKGVLQG